MIEKKYQPWNISFSKTEEEKSFYVGKYQKLGNKLA